jgi:hypothetical protein
MQLSPNREHVFLYVNAVLEVGQIQLGLHVSCYFAATVMQVVKSRINFMTHSPLVDVSSIGIAISRK